MQISVTNISPRKSGYLNLLIIELNLIFNYLISTQYLNRKGRKNGGRVLFFFKLLYLIIIMIS